jgi:4-phytase/acid phosphatase
MKLLRPLALFGLMLLPALPDVAAQGAGDDETKLKFALVFMRHGVRSPLKDSSVYYSPYGVEEWPKWPVQAGNGNLTPHGGQLLTLLGGYYLRYFTDQRILTGIAKEDAKRIYFYADDVPRTLNSAKATASGLLPGSGSEVHCSTATPDPLFHPVAAGLGPPNYTLAAAALNGRLGSNPGELTTANNLQFALLERALLNISLEDAEANPGITVKGKKSVQALPLTVSEGSKGSIVAFSGSVDTASTLTEIFLLEYAEGMPDNQVGWGRVTQDQIAQLTQLHTLDFDLKDRTPYIAQAQGSNLLLHIMNTLKQAASGSRIDPAIGSPNDRLVMLVGHDDQLASVGSLLRANWQLKTFAWNDTPPGGGMVFELRQKRDGALIVRVYYLSQTLDQMHYLTSLVINNTPSRAPIFIPGASGNGPYFDVPLADFNRVVDRAIDLRFTGKSPPPGVSCGG